MLHAGRVHARLTPVVRGKDGKFDAEKTERRCGPDHPFQIGEVHCSDSRTALRVGQLGVPPIRRNTRAREAEQAATGGKSSLDGAGRRSGGPES